MQSGLLTQQLGYRIPLKKFMRLYIYIITLSTLISLSSCFKSSTVNSRDYYPNKQLKTVQTVKTQQRCKKSCKWVGTRKRLREYYENGTVKTKERSLVETSIFGEMLHRRILKREYDESGKLIQKIRKTNLEETIFVYQRGKLVSKKTF